MELPAPARGGGGGGGIFGGGGGGGGGGEDGPSVPAALTVEGVGMRLAPPSSLSLSLTRDKLFITCISERQRPEACQGQEVQKTEKHTGVGTFH